MYPGEPSRPFGLSRDRLDPGQKDKVISRRSLQRSVAAISRRDQGSVLHAPYVSAVKLPLVRQAVLKRVGEDQFAGLFKRAVNHLPQLCALCNEVPLSRKRLRGEQERGRAQNHRCPNSSCYTSHAFLSVAAVA